MNIKKIILEEVNDFDWAEDVSVIDINSPWIITIDNGDEHREVQKWLYSEGWWWDGSATPVNFQPWPYEGQHNNFFNTEYNESFDAANEDYFSGEGFDDNQRYKWADIKGYLINEVNEVNDFEWVNDIPDTPSVFDLGNNYYFEYPNADPEERDFKYWIVSVDKNRVRYTFDDMAVGQEDYDMYVDYFIKKVNDGTYDLFLQDGTPVESLAEI